MASKKVVRVHFMDDSIKAFAVDENSSADQLKATVVERILMKEDACFAIFERKDGWERCLEPDEKPCELMALWGAESTAAPNKSAAFVFKKKIFLRDDEREMLDLIAKHHVYIQALHSVIESEYPCSVEDAIKLAGLQVQITYGDHKPGNHVVGFLTANLRQFVPKDLFSQKKPSDWEALLFKAHAANSGKTEEDAKTEYLEIVKQWPFYGTTFYPPCKTIGSKKIPNKVIIGVNAEGILLLKKDKELVSTHPFTEICSWASSSTTFAFEFGSQTESQKYTFETKQGAIIAASIQTYIDILVQMLKSGEEEEDDD
jgi:acyl-CoA-binding protein